MHGKKVKRNPRLELVKIDNTKRVKLCKMTANENESLGVRKAPANLDIRGKMTGTFLELPVENCADALYNGGQ